MYFFIALTVIASTFLFVVFTLFKIWRIDTFQAIVFNYLTAAVLSLFFNFEANLDQMRLLPEILPSAGLIGCLFIVVFMIMALTTQKAGLAVASVAAKMSLMIPVIVGITYFKESFTVDKLIGILLAVVAIILTNYKYNADQKQNWSLALLLLPIALFIGSGTVDTSIKFAQTFFIPDGARELFIMSLFGSAFSLGALKLLADVFTKRTSLQLRNLLGGILLGVPNFFSIYFLLKALEIPGAESSIVFSVTSLSIVMLAALSGYLFFGQRLNRINSIGILIAAIAIVLLSNVIGLGTIEF